MTESSRRVFFRQLADRTLGQAADLLGRGWDGLGLRGRTRLRPPGALPEAAFLETCYRCGHCVDVCPAQAIYHVRDEADERVNGTPAIDPDLQPCLVCDGLECMQACPSGALQPLARDRIRMGRAAADAGLCLRTAGQDCRQCVDSCPLGEAAIRLDPAGAVVVLGGCIGCGICQWRCPTRPKAIAVRPA